MANIIKKLNDIKLDVINTTSNLSTKELEDAITYAADKYYNTSESVITDEVYDMLIDFLKLKDPKSKVLKNVGSHVKSKNKVKLDYWLGSMDKIKPPSPQLESWKRKFKPPYNLSDKLDGISALLIYTFDNKIKMFTRGTATEGMDISPLIKYLNLPDYETVKNYCKENKIKGDTNLIAFRGELIIKDNVFEKNWSKTLKNARNSVAGLVNSKTINPELAKDTDLVLYEVVDPFYTMDKQLEIIEELGFNCVIYKVINQELTFDLLSKYLKERRSKGIYLIDGIIVTSMKNQERNIEGNPEYAFAFKDVLEDQKAITTVESIEWNISKDGLIKPTVILKPVSIGGVEIKRATGFNARFIVDNILGSGAQVEIIRSGDVIPKIEKVLKPSKSGKPEMPTNKWKWNETQVDIVLEGKENNKSVLIKNIYHFFSSLETKGLGEKNVEKMVEAGLDTIPKILDADVERFLMVDGFKEKTSQNLVASIEKAVSNIPLAKLMSASNKLGHGIGEERMKQVLAIYPNLLGDYKKWTKQEFINKIKEIEGWEDKTSTLLVNNFFEFISFYESIKNFITLEAKKKITKGEFTNKTVVLTGFRDKILQDKIENQGGKIGSSISKNTDYLVVKDKSNLDEPTDKIKKAQELNIKIITKDKLVSLLK
jgi:NAD-dependent DNA ligase